MNEYKVEFSYKRAIGGRITEQDTTVQSTAQDAVDKVREWYGDLVGVRIERVWVDRNNRWEVVEAWE